MRTLFIWHSWKAFAFCIGLMMLISSHASIAFGQENPNLVDATVAPEDLVIPDIFPDSALPAEERRARERLRYLDSIKKILRPDERLIVETPEEEIPEFLETSLERRFESIEEVMSYLRFIAFSLENPEETDQIVDGLVQAYLSLEEPEKALNERGRIRSSYWQIRSGNHVARYFIQKNQIENANDVLQNNLQLIQKENLDLLRAPLLGKTVDERTVMDLDFLLSEAVILLADAGNTFDLIRSINMISTPDARINTIFSYVERVLENRKTYPQRTDIQDTVLANILSDTFDNLRSLQHPLHGSIAHYITLARLYRGIDSFADAVDVLRYTRDFIVREKPVSERDALWISLIEPFIDTNSLPDAMLSTRYIATEIDRAVGMVVLGKAVGSKEQDEEFAIPLLIYAADIANTTRDENVKNRILGEIIAAQSVIGRFNDAYLSILKLDDINFRYQAFATMGNALIAKGRYEEAYQIINSQVPYINMRAPILVGIAEYFANRGDDVQVRRTLLDAVQAPEGFTNANFGLSIESLTAVMDAQIEYGKSHDDEEIFNRITDLVISTDDSLLQISTFLNLASREIERNRFEQASRLINYAWRIIVSQKNSSYFPEAIERMIEVQIKMQDLLNAFDAAVLLPTPDINEKMGDTRHGLTFTRYRALNLVSRAAVNIGQIETAFRAANTIDNSSARTYALSRIPVFISEHIKKNKEKDLLDTKPEEQTDERLDPSYISS